MRLDTGHEALVARVLTEDGRTGFGFSLALDAAQARHMAEWHAGLRSEKPKIEPLLGHPWETAYVAGEPVPWNTEPGFGALAWLSG